MSSNGGDSAFPAPKPPPSGARVVLQYTGIPPSWLDKRPSLPSRNWLLFLGTTSAIAGYYIYDRQQCKRIRREYVDSVKHLADVPLHSLDYPRKVTVYGAKWPGDEDSDRCMRYFRKYVKPILVAAAVDYEMITGKRHGDVTRRIADSIRSQRRLALGLDKPPIQPVVLPNTSPEDIRRRELEGGIVIVGRPTFKEFMAGLARGWTGSLEVVDKEELLARVLESDGNFDEPEPEFVNDGPDVEAEPLPTVSKIPSSKSFSSFTAPLRAPPSPPPASSPRLASLDVPPAQIPSQPPILFVPFINFIGFTQIPLMIWEFFNERHKVRAGAQAAIRLIERDTRPFSASGENNSPVPDGGAVRADGAAPTHPPTDLDFNRDAEEYYKKSIVKSFTSTIEKARTDFYAALPAKLETARALARGTREPTKEEKNFPPPTEVELRAERMKKESRWRADEEGWDIINPEKEVEWDERLRSALRVFVDPRSPSESFGASKA
ncbi:mitochondrial import inner membrane translocase subunit Tim54 [Amylocystis lapponica]|nr:mitochondrial import inner membrane translocase subunit Tim54 [Amylocystis lapponica]